MPFLIRIYRSRLLRYSILIFLSQNFINLGNFLYNLLMGRLLPVTDYASLGAVFSFLSIVSVPFTVFQTYVVKETSKYMGKMEMPAVKIFFNMTFRKVFFAGTILGGLFIVTSGAISSFIHLEDYTSLLLASGIIFVSFPSLFNKSILQGMMFFPYIAINGIAEVLLKVIVSLSLVIMNFRLIGALAGSLTGSFISLILSSYEIKHRLSGLKFKSRHKKITVFRPGSFLPAFCASLSIVLFFNADVVLVRHFFPSQETGIYVALSTLGRIIYFGIGPVIGVMFPVINSRVIKGQSYLLPLFGTVAFSMGISLVFLFFFTHFPGLLFRIFYGGKYTEAANYIILFSYFMTIFSLNSILTHFLLSVSYNTPVYILSLIAMLQSVMITIRHSSLYEVISVNIIVSILYFVVAAYFVLIRENRFIYRIFIKENILSHEK